MLVLKKKKLNTTISFLLYISYTSQIIGLKGKPGTIS